MMSPFSSTIAQGLAAIRQAAAQLVVYSRGSDQVTLAAVVGRAGGDIDEAGNVVVVSNLHDWILSAADLILDGATVSPRRGDRITAGGQVYEASVEGEDVYSHCDPGRTTLRIHTRWIGPEEP